MKPLPPLPYDSLPESDLVKVQALVRREDKEILLTIIPDRGLFTLLLQNAFKRTADFVRDNDLQYSTTDRDSLIAFIVGPVRVDAPSHPPGPAFSRDDRPEKTGTGNAPTGTKNIGSVLRQVSTPGRQGSKGK